MVNLAMVAQLCTKTMASMKALFKSFLGYYSRWINANKTNSTTIQKREKTPKNFYCETEVFRLHGPYVSL